MGSYGWFWWVPYVSIRQKRVFLNYSYIITKSSPYEERTFSSERNLAARQAARRAARASASSSAPSRLARRRCDFADGLTPPSDTLELFVLFILNTLLLFNIIFQFREMNISFRQFLVKGRPLFYSYICMHTYVCRLAIYIHKHIISTISSKVFEFSWLNMLNLESKRIWIKNKFLS